MHDKMMRLMNAVGRRSWDLKSLAFPIMSPWIKQSSSSLCKSYSVMEMKKKLMAQTAVLANSDHVKNRRPQELSLLARKIMENSDQNNGMAVNKNHIITQKATESVEDYVDTSHPTDQFKKRLEALAIDVDDTLNKPKEESALSLYSDSMFVEHEAQDNSVESILFLKDLKTSTTVKPSPLLGTEDPTIPPSKVPCVGCGSLLQCQHNTFPGFLPSERFKLLSHEELKVSICQRCYYIRHCDAFVEVSAKPEEFAEMISKIRHTKSIVVMVVDVMDIGGSIVPDLMKYIGRKHPLIIAGNKADLLAPDGPHYLKRVKSELEKECYNAGLCNIKKCTLISAKTGFGIEKLISQLFSFYQKHVDVYIVGTANAGKSSLFNTLLASDYCKHTARDLIERATISVWPGTTLNLLKFPIMQPHPRTSILRHFRIQQELAIKKEQKNIMKMRKQETALTWELKEGIAMTDLRTDTQRKLDDAGSAWGQEVYGFEAGKDGVVQCTMPEPTPFEPEDYKESYWAYDTPGIINPNQIMNLLTPKEAPYLTPVSMVVPRCLFVKPGGTVFVSGLARLDYVQGTDIVILVVHTGPDIPIHVITTDEADRFYEENVGTATLGIPLGDSDRLMKLPSLVGKELTVKRVDDDTAAADIQLSSLGWVSVAPRTDTEVIMKAYTPGMMGLSLRIPALMPKFTEFKGKREKKTQFFKTLPPGSALANKYVNVKEDN